MPSPDDVDVVGDLEAVGIEIPGVGRAGADSEAVRHGDAGVPGLRAVDRGAEVGRREVQREWPVVECLVERGVEGIDNRRGQEPVVPDDDGVRLVVLSRPAQRQHVLPVVGAGIVIHRVQVTSEDRLASRNREIQLGECLMLGVVVRNPVLKAAAGIGRDRHVLEELHRDRAEPCRIDPVVRETRARRQDDLPAAAGRRRNRGEIAAQHGLGRHEADGFRRVASLDLALVTAEEEQPVFQQRSAERAAELVALQRVALGREEVPGVEPVVPHELEHVAVEAIRSRLRDDVDGGGGVVPVARRQRAGLDLELLDRVGERRGEVQVVEGIVVRAAVHDVRHAVGLAAGDGNRDRRVVLVGVEIPGRRRRRETGEENQLRGLAAVERNLVDPLVVDDLSHTRGARFDHGRIGEHRDLFAKVADAQRDLDRRVGVDLQDDAVLHVGVEPRERDLELIRPDRQVRKDVATVRPGDDRSGHAGVRFGDGDGCPRQHAAAGVAHGARQLRAGHRLRPAGPAGKKPHENRAEYRA